MGNQKQAEQADNPHSVCHRKHTMILLLGFIKKNQKTPKPEMDLAKQGLKALRGKQ